MNHEREKITLIENPNHEIVGININDPQLFGIEGFRKLMKYQIASSDNRELLIFAGAQAIRISKKTLSDLGTNPRKLRMKVINDYAQAMLEADKVTLQIPSPPKDSIKRFIEEYDYLDRFDKKPFSEEMIVRNPQNDEARKIIKNQSLWSERIVQAEWYNKSNEICAMTVIIPSKYVENSQRLEEASKAITGANIVRILSMTEESPKMVKENSKIS